MNRFRPIATILLVCIVVLAIGVTVWRVNNQVGRQQSPADDRSGMLAKGEPTDFLQPLAIGYSIRPGERPQIANVQIVDLDQDGLADVVDCDVNRNQVSWIRQFPKGVYTE